MKLFTKRLIIFFLFPFLLVTVFDLWLRNENSTYKEKYLGLIKAKDSVQVLILGASGALRGVDPTQFKEFDAYNLANGGQEFYFSKRLTIKAIDNGVSNLKYVFISINYMSLFKSSQGIQNKWSYYGNGVKYKDESYFLSNISPFLWGYTPLYSISMAKNKILKVIKNEHNNFYLDQNHENKMTKGYLVQSANANMIKRDTSNFNKGTYQQKMKKYTESKNSERDSVTLDLENFIIYLKSHNITPILFSPPTYREFNKYYEKEQLRRNSFDLNKICNHYNIEHWDYMNDSRFILEDFRNEDHLGAKGSQKFSNILSNRLSDYDQTHIKICN
jgi:hypothetical protein